MFLPEKSIFYSYYQIHAINNYLEVEEIIFKECTNEELEPDERLKLEMWLRESAENQLAYTQLKLAFLYPNASRRSSIEKKVMDDVKKRIGSHYQTTHRSMFFQRWMKVAALFVLFLSAIFIIYFLRVRETGTQKMVAIKMIEKVSLPGQKITTMLPDGTIVKLNADSKIVVPEFFSSDVREVQLIGEAFFEVVKDEARPFVIHTKDLKVRVLGTSFNVRAYDDEAGKSVAVKSGHVAVSRMSNEDNIDLTPNQMVSVFDNGTLEKGDIANQDLIFGWTDQRLVFRDESLHSVLKTISRWYGVSIDQKGENQKGEIEEEKLYTANYKNPVLNEVMASLSHVYNFNYTITDDEKKIIIK